MKTFLLVTISFFLFLNLLYVNGNKFKPQRVFDANNTAITLNNRKRGNSFEFAPGPKVVCEDISLIPCGDNTPLESSICCPPSYICCINEYNNYISCAPPGGSCCVDGHACDVDYACCGFGCMPKEASCCFGETWCPQGTTCPLEQQYYCQNAGSRLLSNAFLVSLLMVSFFFSF